jgi:hypothetical protein
MRTSSAPLSRSKAGLKDHVFQMLTWLSLLMCAMAIGLWVRTYWREDIVHLRDCRHSVFTGPGRIWLESWPRRYFDGFRYLSAPVDYAYNQQFGPFLGFTTLHSECFGTSYTAIGSVYLPPKPDNYPPFRTSYYALPCWLVVVVTGALPIVWLKSRPTPHPGLQCSKCGYDLRATPTRCPECGSTSG